MRDKPRETVAFEAGGESYTLAFGINALCEIEQRLNVGVHDVGSLMSGPHRFSTMRILFGCALADCAPDITPQQAGELMESIGLERADALIARAWSIAFPAPEKTDG